MTKPATLSSAVIAVYFACMMPARAEVVTLVCNANDLPHETTFDVDVATRTVRMQEFGPSSSVTYRAQINDRFITVLNHPNPRYNIQIDRRTGRVHYSQGSYGTCRRATSVF